MGCAPGKHGADEDEVFRLYDMLFLLGKGGTSQTHEAMDRGTGVSVAIKCVVKEEVELKGGCSLNLQKQGLKWSSLSHANICRLLCQFEDKVLHYYVMEVCDGGTLFEKLEEELVLEEPAAGRALFQMFNAVDFLHVRDLCHRDLKPESWLLSDRSAQPQLKLINFKLMDTCKDASTLTHSCGTLHYLAPEVLTEAYGKKCDIWTMGVVMFLSVYGCYPFDGEDCQSVMQGIVGAEPNYSDTCYALSSHAIALLKELLSKDPAVRPRANKVLTHKWFTQRSRPSVKVDRKSVALGAQRGSNQLGPRHSILLSGSTTPGGSSFLSMQSQVLPRPDHALSALAGSRTSITKGVVNSARFERQGSALSPRALEHPMEAHSMSEDHSRCLPGSVKE